MKTPHLISGQLAGSYSTLLASSSTEQKRLEAVLCINEENSYGTYFKVTINGEVKYNGQGLGAAVREYDRVPDYLNPDVAAGIMNDPAGIDWNSTQHPDGAACGNCGRAMWKNVPCACKGSWFQRKVK